uniref:DUF4218 domain-containing protein n=1 Tax=Amphimedon queenslandica TaxID=400682 RepID=A0A1X7VI43_AMPQE
MHRLLSTAILVNELDEIQEQIMLFYDLVPELYDSSLCTANVHSLCHLVPLVHYWGPLWTVSAFGFENINDILKAFLHLNRFRKLAY